MTFFYDLNKKLKEVADSPKSVHQNLNEGAMVAELKKSTVASYAKKAAADAVELTQRADGEHEYGDPRIGAKHDKKAEKRVAGVSKAVDRLTKEDMDESTGDYSAKKARAGKDIGKPGKAFAKIAKSAGERYGSKERGEKVAGAVLAKLRGKNESVEEGFGDMMQTAGAKLKGLKANITKNPADRQAAMDAHRGIMKKELSKVKPGDRRELSGPSQRYWDAENSYAQHKIGLDNNMEEGLGDVVKKVGSMAKKVGSKALDTLGHGSDEDLIRDLQKKAGVPQHGKKGMAKTNEGDFGPMEDKMTPKQKKFAALAEPKDKITFADKIAGAKKDVDEGWDDMLKDVERRRAGMKTGEKVQGHKGEIEKTATGIKHTRKYDPKTGETDTGDDAPQGEKRRGRPKGTGKSLGAKGPSGKSKLMTKEGTGAGQAQEIYNELAELRAAAKQAQGGGQFPQGFASRLESVLWAAMTMIKNNQSGDAQVREEELDEKAVSKKQQKFMGMVHATQKGEKIPGASKELKKVAKTMKKGDVEDYAATKHKGLPEKKKKKTEEAGGVDTPTASSGFSFGKGIYDSINREVEEMIAESMNISMNSSSDGPNSLTVTATDEDAAYLAKILKSAGLGGGEHGGCGCGETPCSCGSNAEVVDENQPDWPTNTEYSDDALQYSGGLNKPKTDVAGDGQTTVPVAAVHTQDEDALRRLREMAGIAKAEEAAIKRMMEMAGMNQANRLDEGILDKLKGFAVPKLMKLLGPDADNIANAVRQATGGDLTPSKENAMKVVKALGIDKAAAQSQSQMAEGIAGNWQGKLIQALYTLGLGGSAAGGYALSGGPGGILLVVGMLMLMMAEAVYGSEEGQVGAMGRDGNKGFETGERPPFGMSGYDESKELDEELQRIREMAGIKEAAKPDYIDLDKDGNKEESMKKAAADKAKDEEDKKIKESIFSMTNLWKAYKN